MAEKKKRKSRGWMTLDERLKSTEPHMLDEDDMFLVIDLGDTASLVKHIPLLEGNGVSRMIPMHFIGHDKDFGQVLWKMREFRMLDEDDQKMEKKRWNDMKRKEKDLYRSRKDYLVALQVEKRTENGLAERPVKRQRKNPPATITPANPARNEPSRSSRGTSNGSQASRMSTASEPSSTASALTTASITSTGPTTAMQNRASRQAPTQETTTVPPPPGPLTNTARTASHTTTGVDSSESEANVPPEVVEETYSYAGLASSLEQRVGALPKKKKRQKPSGTRVKTREHKVGTPCELLFQQGDSKSMDSVHDAMKSFARALDTLSMPTRLPHEPRHTMALLILSEVKETRNDGGGTNSTASIRLRKPALTLLTSSNKDFKKISQAVAKSLKHKDPTEQNRHVDLRVLLPQGNQREPVLSPVVKAYVEAHTRSRNNPPKTPRTWNEIQQDLTKELNKENRRP